MMRCGLLGRKLAHSYSPRLHAALGRYSYDLFEVEPEDLGDFLRSGAFDALNVTIPYKRAVMPYCAALSPRAAAIGSVNTLLRRSDGTLFGDNTDAAGFAAMLAALGVDPAGGKALVLGSGGASRTACHVLRGMGAQVVVISRTGRDNYENIADHADARLIVNATPVGMYPDTGARIIDIAPFERLEGVCDMIYNPARTTLLEQAEVRRIPCVGGLVMLVEQACAAAELFTGAPVPAARSAELLRALRRETLSLALIGMPGCGKSTVARALGELMGREVIDCDMLFERETGVSPADYLSAHDEADFRAIEGAILERVGAARGAIISTGGGCVTVSENRARLRRNAVTVFIERDIAALPVEGRPLSGRQPLSELYVRRLPLYRRFADAAVRNDGTVGECAARVLEVFYQVADNGGTI